MAKMDGGHSHKAKPGVRARTYTVRKGDTLSGISKKYTGKASNYPSLARSSGIKNPNLIYPGQRINLPSPQRTSRR